MLFKQIDTLTLVNSNLITLKESLGEPKKMGGLLYKRLS